MRNSPGPGSTGAQVRDSLVERLRSGRQSRDAPQMPTDQPTEHTRVGSTKAECPDTDPAALGFLSNQHSSRACYAREFPGAAVSLRRCKADKVGFNHGENAMKMIVAALIAISAILSVAAPASAAWDTKTFWEQLDQSRT
jgi:hypothetical protein